MNISFIRRIKSLSNNHLIFPITSFVWILSTIFLLVILYKPLSIREKAVENQITQKTTFNYVANVDKSIIYPSSRLVNPDKIMFSKLLKDINISIDTSILSQKPIAGGLQNKISVFIESEQLPKHINLFRGKKVYETLITEKNFNKSLPKINIAIDFKKSVAPIFNAIFKQTGYTITKYTIKVVSDINQRNLHYKNELIPISNTSEFKLDYYEDTLTQNGQKEFTKSLVLEKETVNKNYVNLFSAKIPVISAKIIMASIWLIITLLLALLYRRYMALKAINDLKKNKIDSKYKSRLINLSENISREDAIVLILDDFSGLTSISDEKDLPILRYEDSINEKVIYYVVDDRFVYSFELCISQCTIEEDSASVAV